MKSWDVIANVLRNLIHAIETLHLYCTDSCMTHLSINWFSLQPAMPVLNFAVYKCWGILNKLLGAHPGKGFCWKFCLLHSKHVINQQGFLTTTSVLGNAEEYRIYCLVHTQIKDSGENFVNCIQSILPARCSWDRTKSPLSGRSTVRLSINQAGIVTFWEWNFWFLRIRITEDGLQGKIMVNTVATQKINRFKDMHYEHQIVKFTVWIFCSCLILC